MQQSFSIMLGWTVIFLIIALIAGLLGFTGIAGVATGIARILFIIFLVLFLVSLIARIRRFDIAFSIGVIYHLEFPDRAVARWYAATRAAFARNRRPRRPRD